MNEWMLEWMNEWMIEWKQIIAEVEKKVRKFKGKRLTKSLPLNNEYIIAELNKRMNDHSSLSLCQKRNKENLIKSEKSIEKIR